MGNFIILDLEWNQASKKEYEIKEIMFEILEIGAIRMNEKKEVTGTFSSLIKPQVYKTMHYMTEKVVHFDIKNMENEKPFVEVMREFLLWCGESPVFCTWGPSDMTEIQRNMSYYKMAPLTNGPLLYFDIQKMFSLQYEDGKNRISLENAVDKLKLKKFEEFHTALADANYTAEIFKKIDDYSMKFYSYDNFHYPKTRNDEIHVKFPTYNKYISKPFRTKHLAMNDNEVSSVRCVVCNKNAKRIIKWFSPSSGKYYLCVAKCRDHGYIKAKVRIKKIDDLKIYVIKTVKNISEQHMIDLKNRYKKAKSKNQSHQTQTYSGAAF